jgi:hypothetical protein
MKESAKAITPLSADASRLGHGRRRPRPVWRREVQGPMRPMAVVVIDELSKDVLQMRLVDDQKPVETLGASGSNEALGHSVRLRRANRSADDLDAVAPKDRIETGRERVVAIADEKTNRVGAFREHPVSWRACCVTHRRLGWSVQPAKCTRRTRKHTALSLLQTIQTLRFVVFNRAAALVRPGGTPTLRLTNNAATRRRYQQIEQALPRVA